VVQADPALVRESVPVIISGSAMRKIHHHRKRESQQGVIGCRISHIRLRY
jgi:hypothetical protein